jgi:hypothetical protein
LKLIFPKSSGGCNISSGNQQMSSVFKLDNLINNESVTSYVFATFLKKTVSINQMKINIVLVIMMSLVIIMISGCADAPTLISAVEAGDIEEIRALLKEGTDVNARNNLLETVLHQAVMNHRSDIIRILLDAGADVNIKDQLGKTPLFWAAYDGPIESVKLFLDKGSDVNAKDNNGKTPLVSAAEGNNADIIKFLISRGADLDTAIAWTESVAVKNPQGGYWVATAKLLEKFAQK